VTIWTRTPALSRREFGIGLACAGAAGAAAAGLPRDNLNLLGNAKLEAVIPQAMGPWRFVSSSGLVVPPEDQLSRALYSQLLTRVYSNGSGSSVMLLIAQSASQTGILQIHRPEICYAAGGYQLSRVRNHRLQMRGVDIPAIMLSATTGDRTEQIVYWTRIGRHLPTSWVQQRLAVAIDNLHGIIPDAVLVRISTLGSDPYAAVTLIDGFLEAVFQSVSASTREFLAA
jgi:EpsI family protein